MTANCARPKQDLDSEKVEVDDRIEQAFEQNNYDEAATLFIRRYGGEILAFIAGRVRSESDASDVFSVFLEDFWRGLPKFQWRTTMRSWAYTLARNAYCRHSKAARRKSDKNTGLSGHSLFLVEAKKIRSATRKHLRTEVKSKMRTLREQLPEEDQSLLILRIDKKMSWNELAAIMSGQGEEREEADKKKWAARLRKRFQAAKDRLKEMAYAEGLLDGDN